MYCSFHWTDRAKQVHSNHQSTEKLQDLIRNFSTPSITRSVVWVHVDAPGEVCLAHDTAVTLASHFALGADLAIPFELANRFVDEVHDILVANVACVGRLVTLDAQCAGSELDQGALLADGGDLPGAATRDVINNSLAVRDQRRAIGGLILKGRVAAVVDAVAGLEGVRGRGLGKSQEAGDGGNEGETHFEIEELSMSRGLFG